MSDPELPIELPRPDSDVMDSGFPPWMERWVWAYLRDWSLWPVAFAVMGHVMILVAPVILWAGRDGNLLAYMILFLLVSGTIRLMVIELARLRQPGRVCVALLITWAGALGAAWAGWTWGLL